MVMDVLDGSNANSFWLIPCSGVINEHQQRNGFFPMESDLVLLTLADSDGRGESSHCLVAATTTTTTALFIPYLD